MLKITINKVRSGAFWTVKHDEEPDYKVPAQYAHSEAAAYRAVAAWLIARAAWIDADAPTVEMPAQVNPRLRP
jgi:hypothetical protein